MNFVLTGATGYIGVRLFELAEKRGHTVVHMSRRPPKRNDLSWIPFDLTDGCSYILPLTTQVVLHLAANTSGADCDAYDKAELLSAQTLLKATQQVGAKFIFVSSQTARPNAPTNYGRTKWHVEQEVLAAGGWVVRPGLVYGSAPRGVFGSLINLVDEWHILPAFLPSPSVQPIHVDDLNLALLRIAERDDLSSGIVSVGATIPISFTKFLSAIARFRLRRRRWYFPVPTIFLIIVLKVIGTRWKRKLNLNRLQSLLELPRMEATLDLQRLDLVLRPLESGLTPSGKSRRRYLLAEGRALFSYITRELPTSSLLRRYARMIDQLQNGQPLNLPSMCLHWPGLLGVFDDRRWISTQKGMEFNWRMNSAIALVEATPQGAYRFLGIGRTTGLICSVLDISRAVCAETFLRVLKTISYPLVRRFFCKNSGQK